jgi:hypothetical protein
MKRDGFSGSEQDAHIQPVQCPFRMKRAASFGCSSDRTALRRRCQIFRCHAIHASERSRSATPPTSTTAAVRRHYERRWRRPSSALTLVLEFRFRPYGAISRTRLTESPRIIGASCPNPVVKAGTVITNAKKYETCQRSGTGAVTVIANSTIDGARFFIPAVAPAAPPPPDFPQVLVGNYQVRLGPGGGCNGGAPNSFPPTLATITIDNAGAVFATNECGQTSRLSVADNGHGFWWGEPISFDLRNGGVLISEERQNGNSWQKVQR